MITVVRICFAIAAVAFFAGAVIFDINPSGVRWISYDIEHDNVMISRLFPADRLAGIADAAQQVLREPVYFRVRYPQRYTRAEVTLEYENKGQDFIQIGLKQEGDDDWDYAFQPVENQSLDTLTWDRISEGSTTLWQREKKFESISDFLESYYDENVGAYNYDLLKRFTLTSYQPVQSTTTIDRLLRGPLSWYTYVKDEDLDWTIRFIDFNRTEGADPIVVSVRDWKGTELYHREIPDDGAMTAVDPASSERVVSVKLPDLPEGAYRLDWQAGTDIFVTQIETAQHLIAFIDQVYIVNNIEYRDGIPDIDTSQTKLLTTVGTVGFFTAHPLGLQTVHVDGEPVEVDVTHEQIFYATKNGISEIVSPENDLLIRGDGLFYFSEQHVFNPEVLKLKTVDPDIRVDYIIANYVPPERGAGDVRTVTAQFDLESVGLENGSLRFIISAPDLQDKGALVKVRNISVILEKPPFTSVDEIWDYLVTKLQNVF